MHTNLLCTFTNEGTLENTLIQIADTYIIVYDFIYILQSCDDTDSLFITYNIDADVKPKTPLENTILMHRKKQTNTLYTINALNIIVRDENQGRLDSTFEVNWESYRNTIILTNNFGARLIPTKIYDVINLK